MKKRIIILTAIILLISCSTMKSKTALRSETKKENLSYELCMMYGFDQGIRDNKLRSHYKILKNADSINFNNLVEFVEKNGYPNKKLLGSFYKNECVQAAAGAILLHNPQRLVKNEKYFNLFLNEVRKGNMKVEALALVLDKYYWMKSHGKEVLYGSQFGKPCIENKNKTNKARIKIGLKPLKDTEFKTCVTK